jgi:hypothetical protein
MMRGPRVRGVLSMSSCRRSRRARGSFVAALGIVPILATLLLSWPARPVAAVSPGFAFGIGGPELPGGAFERAAATTADAAGNVYVAGVFRGTVDFAPGSTTFALTSTVDPISNVPTHDAFVAKYRRDGGLVWARSLGGTSEDAAVGVAVDQAGNVYLTGEVLKTAYFRDGSGGAVRSLDGDTSQDVFVLKLDANGGYVWGRRVSGPNPAYAGGVAVDGAGNTYVTGSFSGVTDFDPGPGAFDMDPLGATDGFLLSLDANGAFRWAQQFEASAAMYTSGVTLGLSGAYVVGHFTGAAFSGRQALASAGGYDGFVVQYGPSGIQRWTKRFGGAEDDFPRGIAADPVGFGVYITGDFRGSGDFDPGPGTFTLTSAGGIDGFVLKLDAFTNGEFVWAKAIGGAGTQRGLGVAFDKNRNLYVAGHFSGGAADFDPGPGVYTLDGPIQGQSGYALKLDANADFVWARALAGDGGLKSANGVATDGLGALYLVGTHAGTAALQPGPPTTLLDSGSATNQDAFVLRLVEDAPTNVVPASDSALMNAARTFSAAGGNRVAISAPDTGADLKVTLLGTNGVLSLRQTQGLTLEGSDGVDDPVVTFTGRPAAVNAALDGLTFKPNTGFTGQAGIEIRSGIASEDNPTGIVRADVDSVPILVGTGPCAPRPRVQVRPAAGGGALEATIAPTPLVGGGANAIAELRFGALDNARVTLNGQVISSGQVVGLPPNTGQVTVTVQRATAGRAMTAHLTVVDGCGAWPTFVGAGTAAPGT